MSRRIPRFEIHPQFWHAWEQHCISGDPVAIVERILALPSEHRVEGEQIIPVLRMTTYDAELDGRRWRVLGHYFDADELLVFELQPLGDAGADEGSGDV